MLHADLEQARYTIDGQRAELTAAEGQRLAIARELERPLARLGVRLNHWLDRLRRSSSR